MKLFGNSNYFEEIFSFKVKNPFLEHFLLLDSTEKDLALYLSIYTYYMNIKGAKLTVNVFFWPLSESRKHFSAELSALKF